MVFIDLGKLDFVIENFLLIFRILINLKMFYVFDILY